MFVAKFLAPAFVSSVFAMPMIVAKFVASASVNTVYAIAISALCLTSGSMQASSSRLRLGTMATDEVKAWLTYIVQNGSEDTSDSAALLLAMRIKQIQLLGPVAFFVCNQQAFKRVVPKPGPSSDRLYAGAPKPGPSSERD